MPSLTQEEHDLVVQVMRQYAESIDQLGSVHSLSETLKRRRNRVSRIIAKLVEPDPIAAAIEHAQSMSARLKLKL